MANSNMGPFVKWAGGKTQLLDKILCRVPSSYTDYYEPFIGGGAVLFELQPDKAVISDVNEQLINVYRQLKADAQAVIAAIRQINETPCTKDFYLAMREKYNNKILGHELDAECAGLMIWINKHCFNGLYRVNSKGLFNVPYNNNVKTTAMSEANLAGIGNFLSSRNVDIRVCDFADACASAGRNDFVYFDSPYVPVSETASFTDYTKDGFTYEDHVRLADLFKELDKRGAKIMLSNHDVPLIRQLYADFNIEVVDVRRNINSNAKKRTGREVLVTNYDAAEEQADIL